MQRIDQKRLVPLLVLDRPEHALAAADALLAAGLDIVEVTFRTDAAEEAIRLLASERPSMLVGAGTVLNAVDAERAAKAGAVFAVAPGLNPEVVKAAAEHGMAFCPGVMTPSEVEAALALGCKRLKFFPAGAAGGLPMLKALYGPYKHTGVRFMPTGGVSPGNLRDYLEQPAVAAVGGSWIAERALVNEGRWDEITRRASEALAVVEEVAS